MCHWKLCTIDWNYLCKNIANSHKSNYTIEISLKIQEIFSISHNELKRSYNIDNKSPQICLLNISKSSWIEWISENETNETEKRSRTRDTISQKFFTLALEGSKLGGKTSWNWQKISPAFCGQCAFNKFGLIGTEDNV